MLGKNCIIKWEALSNQTYSGTKHFSYNLECGYVLLYLLVSVQCTIYVSIYIYLSLSLSRIVIYKDNFKHYTKNNNNYHVQQQSRTENVL